MKEAISIASEEAARCNAAKEVIKSLTAQVSWSFFMSYFNTSWFPLFDYINDQMSIIFVELNKSKNIVAYQASSYIM